MRCSSSTWRCRAWTVSSSSPARAPIRSCARCRPSWSARAMRPRTSGAAARSAPAATSSRASSRRTSSCSRCASSCCKAREPRHEEQQAACAAGRGFALGAPAHPRGAAVAVGHRDRRRGRRRPAGHPAVPAPAARCGVHGHDAARCRRPDGHRGHHGALPDAHPDRLLLHQPRRAAAHLRGPGGRRDRGAGETQRPPGRGRVGAPLPEHAAPGGAHPRDHPSARPTATPAASHASGAPGPAGRTAPRRAGPGRLDRRPWRAGADPQRAAGAGAAAPAGGHAHQCGLQSGIRRLAGRAEPPSGRLCARRRKPGRGHGPRAAGAVRHAPAAARRAAGPERGAAAAFLPALGRRAVRIAGQRTGQWRGGGAADRHGPRWRAGPAGHPPGRRGHPGAGRGQLGGLPMYSALI
eukprot:Opistho-2@25805